MFLKVILHQREINNEERKEKDVDETKKKASIHLGFLNPSIYLGYQRERGF